VPTGIKEAYNVPPSTAETVNSTTADGNTELAVQLCASDELVAAGANEFFRFHFAADKQSDLSDSTFQLYLEPLSSDCNCEIWFADQPVETKQSGQYRIVQAGEHLIVHTEIDIPADEDF